MAKRQKIWSTELVEETLNNLKLGNPADVGCFFGGDTRLRRGNLIFKLTKEEEEEYNKCALDPIYFISKYVKFLTDRGETLVKLRDYQKDILNILTEEEYIEDIDEFAPVNRNVILCQSRQSAKCSLNAEITIKKDGIIKKELLYDLFYKEKLRISKNKIYNIYYKFLIKLRGYLIKLL